jgi:subtilisin family serine protease
VTSSTDGEEASWSSIANATRYEVDLDGQVATVPASVCDGQHCAIGLPLKARRTAQVLRVSAVSETGRSQPAEAPLPTPAPPPTTPPLHDVYAIVSNSAQQLSVEHRAASSDEETDALMAALRQRPDVVSAHRDIYGDINSARDALSSTADPDWYKSALNLDSFPVEADGRGVTIAVIDGGVDAQHPALRGSVLDGTTVDEPNVAGTARPVAHATAIAGLIAGHGTPPLDRGVAPGATILPIDIRGSGGEIAVSSAISGIFEAVDRGANIITISFGFTCGSNRAPEPDDCRLADSGLLDAVAYAHSHNVLVVVAAANNGLGPGCDSPTDAFLYPAYNLSVITVGGLTPSGERWSCTPDQTIDVLAPATNLLVLRSSRGPLLGIDAGNSYAAPMIAGIAARLWSMNRQLPMGFIESLLRRTSSSGAVDVADAVGIISGLTLDPAPPQSAPPEPGPGALTFYLELELSAPLQGDCGSPPCPTVHRLAYGGLFYVDSNGNVTGTGDSERAWRNPQAGLVFAWTCQDYIWSGTAYIHTPVKLTGMRLDDGPTGGGRFDLTFSFDRSYLEWVVRGQDCNNEYKLADYLLEGAQQIAQFDPIHVPSAPNQLQPTTLEEPGFKAKLTVVRYVLN